MADYLENQTHISCDNFLEEDIGNDTYNRSKLNNVINLYRKAPDVKYIQQIGDTQYLLPTAADKLFNVGEDLKKEIKEDMLDWERYMYCKENEERKNIIETSYPVRNYGSHDIVIKACPKNHRRNVHTNMFNGNAELEYRCEKSFSKDEDGASSKEDRASAEKTVGNKHFGKKRYDKACYHYTNSLSIYPLKEVFNNRAQTYIYMKNFAAALKDVNQVLEMDPTNQKALYRKVICYKEMRMYEEALREYRNLQLASKKPFSELWNCIQNEMAKLNDKKYTVRPRNGSRKAFKIDISQLSAYANYIEPYCLEVDRTGCARSCVCGFCTEEDQRSRTKYSGLRIKDRERWKILTNALLDEMRITSPIASKVNNIDGEISEKSWSGITREDRGRNNKNENRTDSISSFNHNLNTTNTNEKLSLKNLSCFENENNWNGIKRLLDDVKFTDTRLQENLSINECDINKKLIAFLKNVDPSSLKESLDGNLDEKSLTILLKSIVDSFHWKKEWTQICYILEAVASVNQFHRVIKYIDENTKTHLSRLLDEAVCSNLRNAVAIKEKYF